MKSGSMKMVWLSTTVIGVGLGDVAVSQNVYGTSIGGVLIIAFKCWNGLKACIDAWSYKHETD